MNIEATFFLKFIPQEFDSKQLCIDTLFDFSNISKVMQLIVIPLLFNMQLKLQCPDFYSVVPHIGSKWKSILSSVAWSQGSLTCNITYTLPYIGTWHIEAETKCLPFYRWLVEIILLVCKFFHFDLNFTEIYSQGSINNIHALVYVKAWCWSGHYLDLWWPNLPSLNEFKQDFWGLGALDPW